MKPDEEKRMKPGEEPTVEDAILDLITALADGRPLLEAVATLLPHAKAIRLSGSARVRLADEAE